jgi:hypothetical protein
MRLYRIDPGNTILPKTYGKLVIEVLLSTRRY